MTQHDTSRNASIQPAQQARQKQTATPQKDKKASPNPQEIGGPKGPEPTRYGDWEVAGRCTDF
jgi:hypothetical protein